MRLTGVSATGQFTCFFQVPLVVTCATKLMYICHGHGLLPYRGGEIPESTMSVN